MSRLREFLLPAVAAIGLGITVAVAQDIPAMTFSTASEGVNRFVAAARVNDTATLDKILGSGGRNILYSGDEQADRHVGAIAGKRAFRFGVNDFVGGADADRQPPVGKR